VTNLSSLVSLNIRNCNSSWIWVFLSDVRPFSFKYALTFAMLEIPPGESTMFHSAQCYNFCPSRHSEYDESSFIHPKHRSMTEKSSSVFYQPGLARKTTRTAVYL
jgi:hypothetical protein